MKHVKQDQKGDPKLYKNRVITRNDKKLIAQIFAGFDNCVLLQKLSQTYYVRADETIDTYRAKRIAKTSRDILSIKRFNVLVGKIPQYVTFTCRYCHSKRKVIDVGKMFG